MLIIGLTGSIGTGKSTTAKMFRACGLPVYDADAAVHTLYDGGAAVEPVEKLFPGTKIDNIIDRQLLSKQVLNDPEKLKNLEAIVHPLVHEAEQAFLSEQRNAGKRQVVLEIPLLLESGIAARCDVVVVTIVPADIQRERVLARPNMTAEKFETILEKQMPEAEKRRKAHFVVDTSLGMNAACRQVCDIIRAVQAVRRI
jgi:dephospho-CoA kinase